MTESIINEARERLVKVTKLEERLDTSYEEWKETEREVQKNQRLEDIKEELLCKFAHIITASTQGIETHITDTLESLREKGYQCPELLEDETGFFEKIGELMYYTEPFLEDVIQTSGVNLFDLEAEEEEYLFLKSSFIRKKRELNLKILRLKHEDYMTSTKFEDGYELQETAQFCAFLEDAVFQGVEGAEVQENDFPQNVTLNGYDKYLNLEKVLLREKELMELAGAKVGEIRVELEEEDDVPWKDATPEQRSAYVNHLNRRLAAERKEFEEEEDSYDGWKVYKELQELHEGYIRDVEEDLDLEWFDKKHLDDFVLESAFREDACKQGIEVDKHDSFETLFRKGYDENRNPEGILSRVDELLRLAE